ncbi:mitogen-activated protein kinase kinase 9-like [Rosa rugosa]|uniref:mitogen-activated protein kinase kinase 9-like n=1 Tax=Rosa rugosa TaxID=74645 RepID=UPI002B4018C9|nr:mitogen-activated protein kinase kinase 9-like [Rosa rugosa]
MALLQQRRKIPSLSLASTAVHHRPILSLQTIPRPAVTTTITSSSSTAPISASDLERLQVLGHGSGGTVYKVLHKPTSTPYALKQLHSPAADSSSDNNPLQSELDILRRTTGSPYVVHCHAIFEKPSGDVSVLMEYMDLGSLETLLKSQGPFSEEKLAPIARQVLEGLDYLHKTHKIVHRDIKPGNLLMNNKKEVKIADFGCSSDESCSSSVGTCAYMSPERFDPERYGGSHNGYASDIWSFGVTIMELYVGYFPLLPKGQRPDWASLMCAICFGEVPCLPEGASEDFRSFLECCMHKEASKRWTVAQLLTHPFVCKAPSEECKPNLFDKKRKRDDDGVERSERSQKSIKVEVVC